MSEGLSDGEIVERLRAASDERWQDLWDAVDALVAQREKGRWAGGETVQTVVVDGVEKPVIQMPYVIYSEAALDLIAKVHGLGASEPFDWMAWDGLTRYPRGRGLDEAPVAESIRMVTAISRADRFGEGTLLASLEDGTIETIIDRLRRWYDDERFGDEHPGRDEQIERIQVGWQRLRKAVHRLADSGLESTTPAGWTVKEMVAHVAFWDEAVYPIVNGMFRGRDISVDEWYGGEDLALVPGEPWPPADVHNAREAAWGRARSAEEVLARWDRAHERLLAVVSTITEEEARREEFLGRIGAATYDHYAEHLSELAGGDTGSTPAQARPPRRDGID